MNQEYLNVQFNKLANNLKKSLEQIDFIQKLEDAQNLEGGSARTNVPLNLPSGPLGATQGTVVMPPMGPSGQLNLPSLPPMVPSGQLNLPSLPPMVQADQISLPSGPLAGTQGNVVMPSLPPMVPSGPVALGAQGAPVDLNFQLQSGPQSGPQSGSQSGPQSGPQTGPEPVDPNADLRNVMNKLRSVSTTQPGNVPRLDTSKFDNADTALNDLRANIVVFLSSLEQTIQNSENPVQSQDLEKANRRAQDLTSSARDMLSILKQQGGSNELVDLEFNL